MRKVAEAETDADRREKSPNSTVTWRPTTSPSLCHLTARVSRRRVGRFRNEKRNKLPMDLHTGGWGVEHELVDMLMVLFP